jgi:hypothetical protein
MFKFFEVVRPDMMPELPEQALVGVVVGVGEGVGDLEADAELMGERKKEIGKAIVGEAYPLKLSLKWKLQSLESRRINF